MDLKGGHNHHDCRRLAQRCLPRSIFDYFDGAADDEITARRNTESYRERDLRTGFSIPFRLTLRGMMAFAIRPVWGINYVNHEKFSLPQLDAHVDMSGGALSIGRYLIESWNRRFPGTMWPGWWPNGTANSPSKG